MCKVKAKVKGKEVVLQTIGYRGKREAKSELGDIRQARALIMYKKDAKALRVKEGSRLKVKVLKTESGHPVNKTVTVTVKKWSKGSKLLLPKEEYPFKGAGKKRRRRKSSSKKRKSKRRRKR